MSNQKSNQATVRRGLLDGKKVPEGLSALDNVCSAGEQCPEVQSSPVATSALSALQDAVTTAHTSLTSKQSLAQSLMAATKTLEDDVGTVKAALGTYEAAVVAIAKGNAGVINKAGLASRNQKAPPAALEKVATVSSTPGKHLAEAIISWPPAPGATGYAIELNVTPQSPVGPWAALTPGSRRRRTVKGPGPAAQFLVRVASLGSGGEQSDWSDPILATAV